MNDNNFAGNAKKAIDFLGNEWIYECMGCSIAKGEIKIPGGTIYEGKHTILGADPEIPIPGFLIVNVKRHIRINKRRKNGSRKCYCTCRKST